MGEQKAQQTTELEPTARNVSFLFSTISTLFYYDLHYKESLHFFMTYDIAMADYSLSTKFLLIEREPPEGHRTDSWESIGIPDKSLPETLWPLKNR